jgi:hypothetical protein
MPTFDCPDRFMKDYRNLDVSDQERYQEAVKGFVEDLKDPSKGFRPGLRVKGVQGAPGVFEMTWASDGRATFQYGPELRDGEAHVIWRRIGTHEIFKRP